MISRALFPKMVINNVKRRVWVFALLLLAFFMVLPLSGAMTLERLVTELAEGSIKYAYVIDNTKNWIGCGNVAVVVVVIGSAVFCGFANFNYLYSKKQLDVFHSIPVKRQKLFAAQYLSGFLLFLIPLLICELLSLIICAANHVLTGSIFVAAIAGIGFHLVFFLLFYHLAILAIMLTGRMLIAVLGMLVFWGYVPLVRMVLRGLFEQFFYTFYTQNYTTWGVPFGNLLTLCFSPCSLYLVQSAAYGTGEDIGALPVAPWLCMTATVVLTLALLAVILWLYLRRSSEAAGHSMAYKKTEPVIKILLLIPLSLGCGQIFNALSYGNSDLWWIVGIVFGLLLFQCLIEVIYHYDIKQVARHKVAFGIASIAVIITFIGFRFDLTGYDSYLPDSGQVESVAVAMQDWDTEVNYQNMHDGTFTYTDRTAYRLDHMNIQPTAAVYEIIQAGIDIARQERDGKEPGKKREMNMVTVRYHLNNGKTVNRIYSVPFDELDDQLSEVYQANGFKEAEYPILSEDASIIRDVRVEDCYGELKGNATSEEWEAVFGLLKEDIKDITYAEKMKSVPVGKIFYNKKGDARYSDSYMYYIYPCYKQTLAKLKELGFELQGQLEAKDVKSITVTKWSTESDGYYQSDQLETEVVVTKSDEITQILEHSMSDFSDNMSHEGNYEIAVEFYNRQGYESSATYYFKVDEVPDFLK